MCLQLVYLIFIYKCYLGRQRFTKTFLKMDLLNDVNEYYDGKNEQKLIIILPLCIGMTYLVCIMIIHINVYEIINITMFYKP